MEKKYLVIGGVLFVAFVIGLIYLSTLESSQPAARSEKFVTYAEQIGLDVEKFKTDMASDAVAARVNANLKEGIGKEVNSTPSFFLNGQDVNLPNSVEGIKTMIDPLLADAEEQALPENVNYKGSDKPKVIIEEFSDLQCPACGAYAPTLKAYIEEAEGVALIYKHFPLKSIHPFAEQAAQATEAAAMQGKFWEMHDILFENQANWRR